MKIEYANQHNGSDVYFDTLTLQGREDARVWHEISGVFYNDKPRKRHGHWYDAQGLRIENITAYEQKMQHAFGYIYDLLVTLQQCKLHTAQRKAQKEA